MATEINKVNAAADIATIPPVPKTLSSVGADSTTGGVIDWMSNVLKNRLKRVLDGTVPEDTASCRMSKSSLICDSGTPPWPGEIVTSTVIELAVTDKVICSTEIPSVFAKRLENDVWLKSLIVASITKEHLTNAPCGGAGCEFKTGDIGGESGEGDGEIAVGGGGDEGGGDGGGGEDDGDKGGGGNGSGNGGGDEGGGGNGYGDDGGGGGAWGLFNGIAGGNKGGRGDVGGGGAGGGVGGGGEGVGGGGVGGGGVGGDGVGGGVDGGGERVSSDVGEGGGDGSDGDEGGGDGSDGGEGGGDGSASAALGSSVEPPGSSVSTP